MGKEVLGFGVRLTAVEVRDIQCRWDGYCMYSEGCYRSSARYTRSLFSSSVASHVVLSS